MRYSCVSVEYQFGCVKSKPTSIIPTITPLPVADNGAGLCHTSFARTIAAELSFVIKQLFPASILWIEGCEQSEDILSRGILAIYISSQFAYILQPFFFSNWTSEVFTKAVNSGTWAFFAFNLVSFAFWQDWYSATAFLTYDDILPWFCDQDTFWITKNKIPNTRIYFIFNMVFILFLFLFIWLQI